MSKNAGLNRRSFMKNAGFTALAGATGSLAVGASQANAQGGSPSQSYPRLANGNYDFDTVYNRAGHNCA
ncbi:MAG: twin-arginine translocation signal domain-containing protein, partial [Pseudohongiellaceae bacterium]